MSTEIDNSEQWEDYMSTEEALRLATLKIATALERIADALEATKEEMK